jgi:outer membrane protein assembly factor BamB
MPGSSEVPSKAEVTQLGRLSPAIVNGVVYIGSEGGEVYALNAQTGKLLWTYTTAHLCQHIEHVGFIAICPAFSVRIPHRKQYGLVT